MISKAFQKFKTSKAVIIGAVCLLALVLLTAGIAWRVAGANEALWISYTYADPKGVTLYNAIYSTSNPIFAEQSMRFNKNSNGSATLVGDDFSKSFSKAVIADNWDIEDGTQLDAETFYFDNPGDGQGVRWAYTFTGWHIVAAGDVYIPMETVFQPGDVIPKHVLDTYAPTTDKNNPLVFEPLWGRCYFVQNAKDASDNPTGTQSAATYINPGNDPATPLPTIQDVYLVRSNHEKIFPNGEMTNKVTSDVMELVENYSDLNAYSHAIMLTGDLTVDDSSGSFAMFSNYVWPHSTTIKSLQATRANDGTLTMSEGTKHTFTFSVTASKHGRAEYTIFGSTRFDNVNYKQTTNPIFEIKDEWGDSVSYLAETVRKNDHYFETTARFTTATTTGTYPYIRAYTCEKIVLNGGTFNGVYLAWKLPTYYTQDDGFTHTWYFGRNVSVTYDVILGVQSTEETIGGYKSNDRVIIAGGSFNLFYGAGSAANDAAVVTGNREYILYGTGTSSTEYNPQISHFYGGGDNFKLVGDITVDAYSCTKLGNFYCGGKNFPAAVTGNITSNFRGCTFSGTLSGGGQFADTRDIDTDEKDTGNVVLNLLEGCSVAKNVYGSGEGFINTFTTTLSEKQGTAPDDWHTPPEFKPVAEKQADGSYWILTNIYKKLGQLTGKEGTAAGIRYLTIKEYKYLSEAKAENVTINIDNSTVTQSVYGGGFYASVLGDTNITVTGSSAQVGNVYGGSDASKPVGTVTLYNAINKEEQSYAAPVPTDSYGLPTNNKQSPEHGTVIGEYSWTTDTAVRDMDGIDHTNMLIYTDTSGGTIHGSTHIDISSGVTVNGEIYGGGNAGTVGGDTFVSVNGSTVKGNMFGGGNMGAIGGSTNVTVTSSTLNKSVYGGSNRADIGGSITLKVGGSSTSVEYYIFGGNNDAGVINGDIDVTVTGGTFRRDIYGTSRLTPYNGNSTLTVSGGSIGKNIYGGSHQSSAGNITVNIEGNTAIAGYLFGGCEGANNTTNATADSVNLNISGSCTIGFAAFGGGQNGPVLGDVNVTMSGGTISPAASVQHDNVLNKVYKSYGLYGGGYMGAVSGDTKITLSGGTINSCVFGGGEKGIVEGSTTINVTGGTYFSDTDEYNDLKTAANAEKNNLPFGLYGGGDGQNTTVKETHINISGGTLHTFVFGGGFAGKVLGDTEIIASGTARLSSSVFGGGQNGVVGGSTHVTVGADYVNNVFGGSYSADVEKDTNVTLNGGIVDYHIYGGNDADGNIGGKTVVTVEDGEVYGYVFGGGRNATTAANTEIYIKGGSVATSKTRNGGVYGGGYQAGVGNTKLVISGGTVGGTIDRAPNSDVTVAHNASVFGGSFGTGSSVTSTDVTVSGSGTVVKGSVLGGGNNGTVNGDTKVTIEHGTIGGHVFGGGDKGDVAGSTTVSYANATATGCVYGGGNSAVVNGNTNVTVTSGTLDDIYGGGNADDVIGNVTVRFSGGSIDDFYGGGNAGDVGDIDIAMSGTAVCRRRFYGGGNISSSGNVKIVFNGGTVTANAFGGGSNQNFTGSVKSTDITVYNGDFGHNIFAGGQYGTVDGNCTMRVYGGNFYSIHGASDAPRSCVNGNVKLVIDDAADNTASIVMRAKINNDQYEGVYGGSLKGTVNGSIDLTVKSGALNYVYGGNNTSGNIYGDISVNIEGGTIAELYGGGSKAHINADTADSLTMNISGGTIGKGFGGGMLAYTGLTPKITVTGGDIATLYGGGYQAAAVGSDVTVNNGIIGTLYGGGYAGAVDNAKLIIDDSASSSNAITINGNVYGGGEGITATVNKSTSVTINTDCSFTATEKAITTATESTTSGAVKTTVTNLAHRSSIHGSVYGGGNLGRVGEGIIYVSGESAKVTNEGSTNVLVANGYIGGSVFAGGCGIPGNNQSYDVSMGTVFGYTNVTIKGGYIGNADAAEGVVTGNVYGGGEQSRVFSSKQATNVLIQEESGKSIAIKGSVFGGGDRGEEGATNASVPTVIGDVKVTITGRDENAASNIYFLEGGVYGDGNLCLVKGNRTISIADFNASDDLLKTFYSLQRADTVTMNNSAVVLLGAKDLVAENDEQIYSINRVGHLQMRSGSTIKLDQIVNYLGELSSDVHADRHFIHLGNNGTNNYVYRNDHFCNASCLEVLDQGLVDAYRSGNAITVDGHEHIHDASNKNVVCVANGLYLEVKDETNTYGAVTGLFTLQLLYANPGEGGGFVYGSIPESTGDFICETKMSTFEVASVADQAALNAGTFYIRSAGQGYAPAPKTYDASQTYYKAVVSDEYMEIVDNVGGYENSSYSYYYWYIGGPEVRYDITITGYIGAGNIPSEHSVSIPQHTDPYAYTLYSVNVNDDLKDALASRYTLKNTADDLTGNEIAIQIMLGDVSLGYLTKKGDDWAITNTTDGVVTNMIGYRGKAAEAANNVLFTGEVDQENDTVTWVLHKSPDVNVETKDMAVFLDMDKFEVDNNGDPTNVVTESATLSFSSYISIVKLLPTQYLYHDNLRSYTGVGSSSKITITGNSCFTAEYQTNYIPAAFPSGSGSMVWSLSSVDGIPSGTKITMVDLSGDTPTFYYYICGSSETNIDLTEFMQMGTKKTIASLDTKPAFYNAYVNQEMALFNERLLFVFDFEQASELLSDGTYENTITLNHNYNGTDIMNDSVTGIKSIEEFKVGVGENGIGETYSATFADTSYSDNGTAVLNVTLTEHAEWINTDFRENGLAIEVRLNDAASMPAGMYISYLGQEFYPGADSTVIAVPIYEFGTHELQICNPHGGLSTALGDASTAEYNVSVYCAPDAKYHNVQQVQNIGTVSYTIVANTLNSLEIEPGEGPSRILSVGQDLAFTIYTDSRVQSFALEVQTVNVKLQRKVDGDYVDVEMASVFSGVGETVKSGEQSWELTGGDSGTYRIVFNYVNNTEYLNFIIP